ncbi:hypothetical protein Tco_0937351 [Tanacetum coccineum]|uniref:Transmembrane protein n=1 Tax=Tanacetum coccineum TaxID=301880 RepID=A0ABQ5DGU3_9ASTR
MIEPRVITLGRPALIPPDVGQRKVDSFAITLVNRLIANAKKPRLVSGSHFLWHPRFEPFVSSVVMNVAAVVVIGVAVVVIVAVIVAAVVVESLVGLAKGRPALIPPDVGQRKELFGVESPSEESHCSFPLRALCSCLPLAPYAAFLDFLWHPRFEPFVSSVVVNVAAVVVIGVVVVVIVVVIVAAVVVTAKGRFVRNHIGEQVNSKCQET